MEVKSDIESHIEHLGLLIKVKEFELDELIGEREPRHAEAQQHFLDLTRMDIKILRLKKEISAENHRIGVPALLSMLPQSRERRMRLQVDLAHELARRRRSESAGPQIAVRSLEERMGTPMADSLPVWTPVDSPVKAAAVEPGVIATYSNAKRDRAESSATADEPPRKRRLFWNPRAREFQGY